MTRTIHVEIPRELGVGAVVLDHNGDAWTSKMTPTGRVRWYAVVGYPLSLASCTWLELVASGALTVVRESDVARACADSVLVGRRTGGTLGIADLAGAMGLAGIPARIAGQ